MTEFMKLSKEERMKEWRKRYKKGVIDSAEKLKKEEDKDG